MLNIPNTEKIVIRYGETAQALPHAVIIPNGFSESEEYQILLHELCHYRHKDYLKLWAGLLILCVNWFNPLVWYAFKLFRTDLEMLCDDRVLSVTDNKKEYARVLVKSAAVRSRFVPGAASVHNGKSEVGKRVKRIASLRRYKPVWLFICGLVCVTVCCVCLTDAVTVAVENTMDIVPQITDSANQGEDEALTQPTADENEYASQSGGEAVMQSASLQTASDKSKANAVKINQAESDMQAPRTVEGSYEEAAQSKSENASEGISNDSGDAVQAETDEFTDTESNDLVPNIGSARDDVYSSLGEPESVSSGGSKETYQLDDGSTAVLQYSGDTLDAGYIVN
jgi:hypothetical protein